MHFTEIDPEKPLRLGLNAKGVAKYSDVGHVEGCILEMMQETASVQLMTKGNHTRRIQ